MFKSRTIEGSQPGPHLLIIAGVHGDEYEPMMAVRQLIKQIDATKLRGKLTLVPCVNEGAFRRGHRAAEDDLDLARTFPGKEDGSVTQRLAFEMTKLIKTADAMIDLHTGGTVFALYPLTGYVLHRDKKVLEQQRAMARAFNLPVVWGTSPDLEGRTLSEARKANIPAIYTEYGGGGPTDPQAAARYAQGCINVMARLDMIDAEPVPGEVKYVIEDDRPQSGHLQIGHPAPVAGFFEPAVKLGQYVTKGDPIGTIVDELGENCVSIFAQQSGMVLCLRIRSVVGKDEALATLVEVSDAGVTA